MRAIAQTLLKIINKLFLRKNAGKPSHQGVFDYLTQISIEGKSFGVAGSVHSSGEVLVLRLINKYFSGQDITIFDVGANSGQYQAEILSNVNLEKFKVYSFEPSPSTFELLEKNKTNKTKNFNIGFGSKEETLELFRTGVGSPLSSLHQKTGNDYYKTKFVDSEKVQIKQLDQFCIENNIDHIHYLKLDVEGHELEVLKGAKDTLQAKKIDMIQFEFGPPNIDSRTYLRDFVNVLENDYKIFRVMTHGFHEINYTELDEIFLPINYVAVKKDIIKEYGGL